MKYFWRLTLLIFSAVICGAGGISTQFIDEDAKGYAFFIFNGKGNLGEVGDWAPGYTLNAFFNRRAFERNPAMEFGVKTGYSKEDGFYVFVPGYADLPEYNLNTNSFFLVKPGKVVIRYQARYVPAEDGKYYDGNHMLMDFRCRNLDLQYGTTAERYPVLRAVAVQPGREWRTFTSEFEVKPKFRYELMFRHWGNSPNSVLNGFQLKDLSLQYLGAKEENSAQFNLIHPASLPYEKPVKISVIATGNNLREGTASIYQDDRKEPIFTQKFNLTPDGDRYRGNFEYTSRKFGSFHTRITIDGQLQFTAGGDFVTVHPTPERGNVSSLQRKIGAHYLVHNKTFQLIPSNQAAIRLSRSPDAITALFKQAGFGCALYVFDLKDVQPHPEKLDLGISDMAMALLKKYDITPFGCLGGWWIYLDRNTRNGIKIGSLPDWFYDDAYTRALPQTGSRRQPRTLKDGPWNTHVSGLVNAYGKIISDWSLLVEPQWVLTPEEYLKLQKVAYRAVKESNPSAKLSAGDATADYGHNLTDWLKKLSTLNFEQYADMVSFNPYGSSSDYIDGELNRYSNLLERIRSSVKPGTKLCEGELYYIADSRKKSRAGDQSLFSAADVQRHYLLGLLNQLENITAINETSLLKQGTAVPGDVTAGLNALSFYLNGKNRAEKVETGNKLLRCGIFYSDDHKHAVGVVWALAKDAGTLKFADDANVTDLFGNSLPTRVAVGLSPIYLQGSYERVKAIILRAKLEIRAPLQVRSRRAGDRVHWNILNISGAPCLVEILPDGKKEKIVLDFLNSDEQNISFPSAENPVSYQAWIRGGEPGEKFPVEKITESPSMTPPCSLKLGTAGTVKIAKENGNLVIDAEIIDPEVTASPTEALYNGDSLEVFLDHAPLNILKANEFGGKQIPGVRVYQYAFAAKPNAQGIQISARNAGINRDFATRAELTRTLTPQGYRLHIVIPAAEVMPDAESKGWLGINFELNCRDGAKVHAKQIPDGTERQPSFRRRMHYILLDWDNANLIANGGFESGIAPWKSGIDRVAGHPTLTRIDADAEGRQALRVELADEPAWGPTFRRGSLTTELPPLSAGTYRLRFLLSGNQATVMKINLNKTRCQIERGALSYSNAFRIVQSELVLPEAVQKPSLYMEFLAPRREQNAAAVIDAVELVKLN